MRRQAQEFTFVVCLCSFCLDFFSLTCIPSLLFSFILAFTLYLKYMALIECVINREEDKGNYKSLNLHFILGF